ncbi:MAG TPA: hypothetical protein VFA84_14795 [Acidimicrobiales bacterium]|nr:hypothetical protein [Acidimicrobiales bacterium]
MLWLYLRFEHGVPVEFRGHAVLARRNVEAQVVQRLDDVEPERSARRFVARSEPPRHADDVLPAVEDGDEPTVEHVVFWYMPDVSMVWPIPR